MRGVSFDELPLLLRLQGRRLIRVDDAVVTGEANGLVEVVVMTMHLADVEEAGGTLVAATVDARR